MEFGPRALGSRSILADPRVKDMQKKLNLKIKFRESFRPFAPAILSEYVKDWFEINKDVPYMSEVYSILKNKRGDLPGIHCKNLFLRAKKAEMWLVVCREDLKIDLKEFKKISFVL